MFKEKIIQLLQKETKLPIADINAVIEIPPTLDLGDYAFPCFILAKKLKKAPPQIAQELAAKFSKKLSKEIESIQVKGAYINFFINKKLFAEKIIATNANYGKSNQGKKKKIIVEFSGPNHGKPMHVGHIRSTILGDSLMRIYYYLNYDPIGINYLGDIGLHIGKLIVAYQLWLDKKALQKDPVKELLRLYVKFCAEEKTQITEGAEEELQDNEWTNKAKEKLKSLELGDKKTHTIWNEIKKYSEKGFDKVYEILKIDFNESIGQSEFSQKGKEIVLEALKKGIAKRESDGAVYVPLGERKKFILRNNQTASYITQDLGAAVVRYKKYKFEKMMYVVDFRQADHFNDLFTILKLMGYDFAEHAHHLAFGTVKFENEIFATREGKVILLEDVLHKTIQKAGEEIKKRDTKGSPEIMGVGAVKYAFLKNEPVKDVNFSWDILNFEGNTGPYLQYAYARASSIIKKAKKSNKKLKEIPHLQAQEIALMAAIDQFPDEVEKAAKTMNPAIIANYAYTLAQTFNEFYHATKVIGTPQEAFRLKLVDAFRTTLKNALYLLGIEVMEEM